MWNELERHWTIRASLMKLNAHWVHSFMVLCQSPPSPGNWHHTSEASRSHGFNSGRLCHALPTKPQISVLLWPPISPRFVLLRLFLPIHIFQLSLFFCLYSICSFIPLLHASHTTVEVWHQQLAKSCKFGSFKGLFGIELTSIQRSFVWSKKKTFLCGILQRTTVSGYWSTAIGLPTKLDRFPY